MAFGFLARAGKRVLQVAACAVLIPVFLGLLAMLLLGSPADVAYATVDLARMTASAPAVVTDVGRVEGGHGTARQRVRYQFEAGRRTVTSDRVFAGWAGNHTTWTGGGSLGYAAGDRVTAYYAPGDPTRCALERGWLAGSVGFSFVVWGGIFIGLGRRRPVLGAIAAGSAAYGFGLLFVGPNAVRLDQLHLHAAAWLGCAAIAFAWGRFRRGGGRDEPEAEVCAAG